jgi:hypothetical protein
VPLERIKPSCPLRSIGLQPSVELHQWFRTKSIHPPLGITSDLHQPGVAQHLEVTGHTGLMHADLLDQLVHRPLALADRVEDPSPRRLGDYLEDVKHGGHQLEYTLIHIYICNRMSIRATPCLEVSSMMKV